MSIEDDVREIRRMFSDHITEENKVFTTNAKEHGTMLSKLESIESRLVSGSVEFNELDDRITKVETTLANWKGWGAALIFITGIAVKFIGVLVDKAWPYVQ